MQKAKPIFNKRIFWDTDFNAIDYDKNYRSVITRVFERGDVEDVRQCRRYYGDSLLKDVLTNARWLPKESIYLAAAILGNELTEYKCYTIAQSNPQHWMY